MHLSGIVTEKQTVQNVVHFGKTPEVLQIFLKCPLVSLLQLDINLIEGEPSNRLAL